MPRLRSGHFVTLGLAVLLALCSCYMLFTNPEMPFERRAPLTVLATLAALLIALFFRQLASAQNPAHSRLLVLSVVLAAVALFADVRFVVKYRVICNQIQDELHQLNHPGS